MDDAHLYRAMRYVERNPVRAGMVKRPWEYEWSSAGYHAGENPSLIELSRNMDMAKRGAEWKEYLLEEDGEMLKEMRLKTQRGMVIGTKDFIKKMERKLGHSLQCLNPGRPWKRKAK